MKRVVVVAIVFGCGFAGSVAADPPAKHAATRTVGKAGTTAQAPNRYFVPDVDDPSVLHATPELAAHGFDRGYFEMMSRPRLSAAALASMDPDAPPVRLVAPTDLPPANPYADTAGHVIVVQGTAAEFPGGVLDTGQNGLIAVANQVLVQGGDNFDFIAMFSTTTNNSTAAFYEPLKNDVQGLGDCNFNDGETFGCQFSALDGTGIQQLQGLLYMNSLASWQQWDRDVDGEVHPFDSFDQAVYAVLGQETAHRWAAGLRFIDPRNGSTSKKLLGRDQSHWAAFVDTDASVMDGWDWDPPKDGNFALLNDMDIYSTLDLYAMGALPVASAKPFFFIDNAKYTEHDTGGFGIGLNGTTIGAADVLEKGLPSVAFMKSNGITLGATGDRVDLTIQDIVNAEGNRCPDPDHTQRSFRQAIVLVVDPSHTPAQVQSEIDDLETVAVNWEAWWTDRTGHALTLCTGVSTTCGQALATLGGGTVEIVGKPTQDFIERGDTVHVKMLASADPSGPTVKNAHIAISLDGDGAAHTRLSTADVTVGDIQPGKDIEVPVELHIDGAMPCGASIIVIAQLEADNAPTVREEYRLFPGFSNIFVENFGSNDDFKVNEDGADGADKGELVKQNVALSCFMTPRTPEKDNTPGSAGAYVTGEKDELHGDTSLWSPEIDLKDTVDPQLAFDFWFEGPPDESGDSLLVELSADGKNFVQADEETVSEHGWGLKRVRIRDSFKGNIPAKVTARFIFNGNGHLEGGIDNVRVLDPSGQCQSIATCGCNTDGTASPQTPVAVVIGLLALRALRRRR